jgi:hypothetical protein
MEAQVWLSYALERLEGWLYDRDFCGIDPYDGLAALRLPSALRAHRRIRQLVVQAVKRSPVDLRPTLGVRPRRLAKAAGLIASGYAQLEDAGWGGPARPRATDLLDWLLIHRTRFADARAWGYEFDVQTRWAFYPAGTPNIIVTTFVARALLDWYERAADERYLSAAVEAADYVQDALRMECEAGACYCYVPGVTTLIHNANTLAAGFLARLGALSGDRHLLESSLAAARTTLAFQDERGLWPYGEAPGLGWVDGFHTAYVVGGLYDVWQATGDEGVRASLVTGMRAYLDRLFTADGLPMNTARTLYPMDVHSASSAIDLLVHAGDTDDRCRGRAKRVARWALENLHDPRGYFYYQQTRWYTNRIPYVRWSQAHMFNALAGLIAAEQS